MRDTAIHHAFASSALFVACFAPLAACRDDHEALDTAGFEEAYAQNELGKTDTGGCSGVVVPDKSAFAKRVTLTLSTHAENGVTMKDFELAKKIG